MFVHRTLKTMLQTVTNKIQCNESEIQVKIALKIIHLHGWNENANIMLIILLATIQFKTAKNKNQFTLK